MEIILMGLVLILSNVITFNVGKNFAPTAIALAHAERMHMTYVAQVELAQGELVREKNKAIMRERITQDTNYQLALEQTPKLTDKIKGLHDNVTKGW